MNRRLTSQRSKQTHMYCMAPRKAKSCCEEMMQIGGMFKGHN